MKADAIKLLDFIGKSQEKQFVIPIYQRVYSWEKEQCKQLWDDIIKTGGNDQIEGHFIGSIVFVHDMMAYTPLTTTSFSLLTANKGSPLSRFYLSL